jgi:hypothetical protein
MVKIAAFLVIFALKCTKKCDKIKIAIFCLIIIWRINR